MRQTDQSPPEVTPVFNTGKATRTVYDRLKGDHLWLSDKKKNHVTQTSNISLSSEQNLKMRLQTVLNSKIKILNFLENTSKF